MWFNVNQWFEFFFAEKTQHRVEKLFIWLAIGGFLIHLILIYANIYGLIDLSDNPDGLFDAPIAALYTPFSFILVYEVYLLVAFLPASFTESVGKQFEIVSLIVIRKIFKDISKIELDGDWFRSEADIALTYDLVGILILFFLIYWFYRLAKRRSRASSNKNIDRFILAKKSFSIMLLFLLIGMAVFSLGQYLLEVRDFSQGAIAEISDINQIFYNEFFTVLILADVLILLVSFRYTEQYSLLIRNSGFVISTILIRISFGAVGWLNITLILFGVLFSVLILRMYNAYEQI